MNPHWTNPMPAAPPEYLNLTICPRRGQRGDGMLFARGSLRMARTPATRYPRQRRSADDGRVAASEDCSAAARPSHSTGALWAHARRRQPCQSRATPGALVVAVGPRCWAEKYEGCHRCRAGPCHSAVRGADGERCRPTDSPSPNETAMMGSEWDSLVPDHDRSSAKMRTGSRIQGPSRRKVTRTVLFLDRTMVRSPSRAKLPPREPTFTLTGLSKASGS